jgi:hypothetical protein
VVELAVQDGRRGVRRQVEPGVDEHVEGQRQHLFDEGMLGGEELVLRNDHGVDVDLERGPEIGLQQPGDPFQFRRGRQPQGATGGPAGLGEEVPRLLGVVGVGLLPLGEGGGVRGGESGERVGVAGEAVSDQPVTVDAQVERLAGAQVLERYVVGAPVDDAHQHPHGIDRGQLGVLGVEDPLHVRRADLADEVDLPLGGAHELERLGG